MESDLSWTTDGTPRSASFGDIFCNLQLPWSEKKHVFLEANAIKPRLAHNEPTVIGELGFGLGLNFLLTLDAVIASPPSSIWHYYSIDKFPLKRADLIKVHDWLARLNDPHAPSVQTLSTFLRDYPEGLIQDWHWIAPTGCLEMHFLFGEARDRLCEFPKVHIWFLDGFSPKTNPTMWAPEICQILAMRSEPEATLSTYSAASLVRHNLHQVGFNCHKIKGFGRKREMLTATYPGPPVPGVNG